MDDDITENCSYTAALVYFGLATVISIAIGCRLYFDNVKMGSIINDIKSIKREVSEIPNMFNELKQSISDLKDLTSENVPSYNRIAGMFRNGLQQLDADNIGPADYALKPAGGKILSIRNTEQYDISSDITLFGWPVCPDSTNSPDLIITPSSHVGECWAFKGSSGSAVIKLIGYVLITSVSLEHIPVEISPTGSLITAPKVFSIWGLSSPDDCKGELLGKFTYQIDINRRLQFFQIESPKAYHIIEFKVHSNHGSADFTCVYRIRVHGTLQER